MRERAAEQFSWAGLALGPGAWGANTLVGYALVSTLCGRYPAALSWLAAALAVLALCGAGVSALSYRALAADRDGAPHALLAGVAAALGALFATVILLQGAAVFLLGCAL
ncbi:hypothetical protein [Methylocystis suflitae]|uniref:hypothetical protein n=1 Tax=Methylocystis suflitae TaxID=2951405 RepID=UPI002108A41C|nr:hypothetical protein [Methylocystis suflitae]MCQ4188646.1 hypothetical protein [Methylocystis suflitae]